MESTKSYYLYELQEKYTGQVWMPVIPRAYSIDGNGTMPRILKSENEEVCGGNTDYSKEYLTIESLEDGNAIMLRQSWFDDFTRTISASTDNGETWTAYTSLTDRSVTIATLNTGQKVLLKGNNEAYYVEDRGVRIIASKKTNVYGNIMSLVSGDTFQNVNTLTTTDTFRQLFIGCRIVDASNLVLPATTLTDACYFEMFQGNGNLVSAPKLPATTLASGCYERMFEGCGSLTTAPELPATTLVFRCYYWMFWECTSLNYIKCLATDISATDCTAVWVDGVASSGTFVKAASMTGWTTGDDGIPTGWTVQNA